MTHTTTLDSTITTLSPAAGGTEVAAADALFAEDPTEGQQTALGNDYIAGLEESFRIVYIGPLAESGVAILGS